MIVSFQVKHPWEGKFEHMAVLTPIFPPMNSCHAVVYHTKAIITDQLFRAALIAKTEQEKLKAAAEKGEPHHVAWEKFYEPLPFFQIYSRYIRIVAGAKTRDKYVVWKGRRRKRGEVSRREGGRDRPSLWWAFGSD